MNAVATLTKVAIPALVPSCAKFYEVGSYFIDGDVVPHLMEVSPDGEIRYLLLLIPFSKFNLYTALGLLEQMNVLFNFPGLSIQEKTAFVATSGLSSSIGLLWKSNAFILVITIHQFGTLAHHTM